MAEDIRNMESTKGVIEFEKQYDLPHCIVLDSEYCSMGRMIGNLACQISGYEYYDAVILLETVPECGVTKEEYDAYEKGLRDHLLEREEIVNDPEYQKLMKVFDYAIDKALKKGPCLIHDRISKDAVIKKGYTCASAITYSRDMDAKIVRARLSPFYANCETDEEVIKGINEEDNIRRNWHHAVEDSVWGNIDTYDLCINVEAFGRDYSAELLAKMMKK